MKKILNIVLGILICLLLAHYFYLPEMPETTRGEVSVAPDPPECQPGLVNLWNTLVQELAFSNKSAVLIQLNQRIAANGTVQYTQLYFTGDKDGKPSFYEVSAHPGGNVSFKYQTFDYPLQGPHPLAIFSEVERIDFANLSSERCTAMLQTFRNEGAMSYNETCGNICMLSDGSFRPLKKVAFPESACWYTLEITFHNETDVDMPGVNTPGNRGSDHIIAFFEHDLAATVDLVYT